MIRTYANKEIYRNFKITLILSAVALGSGVISAIAHICNAAISGTHWKIYTEMMYYMEVIGIPLLILQRAARNLKPTVPSIDKPIKETQKNTVLSEMLIPISISLTPCCYFLLYFLTFDLEIPNMFGAALITLIPLYVAIGFWIRNCVLIKKELKDALPGSSNEETPEQAQPQEQQVEETQNWQGEALCRSLLQTCGIRFFLRYYRQLKTVPVQDIVLTESYSPEEKEMRLTAAKKIIDLNMDILALQMIVGDGTGPETEESGMARTLLAEIAPGSCPAPVGPVERTPEWSRAPSKEAAATECEKPPRAQKKGAAQTVPYQINTPTRREPMKLTAGDIIYANTNAQLLNHVLGTNYRAWMKTIYPLGHGSFIWIVSFDGANRSGWSNFLYGDRIVEQYDGSQPYPSNIYEGLDKKTRVVFEKCDAGERYYIFRGVFRLAPESTFTHRVLTLTNNQITL